MLRRSGRPSHPAIDFDTLRETISYMHDDVSRTPGLDRLAESFARVLKEIEAASRAEPASGSATGGVVRFLPFRR